MKLKYSVDSAGLSDAIVHVQHLILCLTLSPIKKKKKCFKQESEAY